MTTLQRLVGSPVPLDESPSLLDPLLRDKSKVNSNNHSVCMVMANITCTHLNLSSQLLSKSKGFICLFHLEINSLYLLLSQSSDKL